jgi:hypothetical protein
MKTILVINALNGVFPLVLQKKYPHAKITCAEIFPFYKHHLRNLGFEVMDWDCVGDMKFDLVIGNPPYGKNANLAIKFLNKAATVSDHIHFVLPRTFRKSSVLNRVDPHLHLMHDQIVADEHFPGSITTCYQVWHKKPHLRDMILEDVTHADFEFVEPAEADVCVGRVGGGPCGKVFLDKFDQRSINSHYFLKVKDQSVINKLQSVSSLFRKAAEQTVGVPSLSKTELVKIYTQVSAP